MPICYITLSEGVTVPDEIHLDKIKDIVAGGLLSDARYLDGDHIVLRIQKSRRCFMLGEIELDIFAQDDPQRYDSRDERAKSISDRVSKLLDKDCATWINLCNQGYCRVTKDGKEFYSD